MYRPGPDPRSIPTTGTGVNATRIKESRGIKGKHEGARGARSRVKKEMRRGGRTPSCSIREAYRTGGIPEGRNREMWIKPAFEEISLCAEVTAYVYTA